MQKWLGVLIATTTLIFGFASTNVAFASPKTKIRPEASEGSSNSKSGSTKAAKTEPSVKQSTAKKWKACFDAGSEARRNGNIKEAEAEYRSALKIAESLGPDDRRLPETLKALGWLFYFEGRYKDAEPPLVRALELDRQILGDKSIEVVSTLNVLGRLNRHLSRYAKAERYQLEALDARAGVAGDEEPNRTTLLHNLARVYAESGKRVDDAEEIYVNAIKSEKEKLNDTISSLATYQNNLGMLYAEHKKYDQSEKCLSGALSTLQLLPSREREIQCAGIIANLGSVFFEEKSYKNAASSYRLALEQYAEYPPANPKVLATVVHNYIVSLKELKENEEAAKVAEKYKNELTTLAVKDPRIPPTNIRESMLKELFREYPTDLSFLKGNLVEEAKNPKNGRKIVVTYLSFIYKYAQANKRPSFIAEDYWNRIMQSWKAGKINEALSLATRPEEGDDSQIHIPRTGGDFPTLRVKGP